MREPRGFLVGRRAPPTIGAMKHEQPPTASLTATSGRATLKLASYQKPERREAIERRESAKRALVGERRSASQRVLRALFGT
jgi:hypothetical protein